MLKRMAAAVLVLGLWSSGAWAAGVSGKVIAVDKGKVQLVTVSAPESWIKKGVAVTIGGGRGAIVEVRADTVSIATAKAKSIKVGETVVFAKARSGASGC